MSDLSSCLKSAFASLAFCLKDAANVGSCRGAPCSAPGVFHLVASHVGWWETSNEEQPRMKQGNTWNTGVNSELPDMESWFPGARLAHHDDLPSWMALLFGSKGSASWIARMWAQSSSSGCWNQHPTMDLSIEERVWEMFIKGAWGERDFKDKHQWKLDGSR